MHLGDWLVIAVVVFCATCVLIVQFRNRRDLKSIAAGFAADQVRRKAVARRLTGEPPEDDDNGSRSRLRLAPVVVPITAAAGWAAKEARDHPTRAGAGLSLAAAVAGTLLWFATQPGRHQPGNTGEAPTVITGGPATPHSRGTPRTEHVPSARPTHVPSPTQGPTERPTTGPTTAPVPTVAPPSRSAPVTVRTILLLRPTPTPTTPSPVEHSSPPLPSPTAPSPTAPSPTTTPSPTATPSPTSTSSGQPRPAAKPACGVVRIELHVVGLVSLCA